MPDLECLLFTVVGGFYERGVADRISSPVRKRNRSIFDESSKITNIKSIANNSDNY